MPEIKEWTLMFYLASDNPLAPGVVSQLKAIKAAGFHPQANVGAAMIEGRDQAGLDERRREPLGRAAQQQAGPGRAEQGEGAVLPGERDVGDAGGAEHRLGAALPMRPIALAVDFAVESRRFV